MWSSDSALNSPRMKSFSKKDSHAGGTRAHTSTLPQFTTKYSFYKSALFLTREKRKQQKPVRHTYTLYLPHKQLNTVGAKKCLPSLQRYDDQIELNDKLKGTHHDAAKCSATTKTRV